MLGGRRQQRLQRSPVRLRKMFAQRRNRLVFEEQGLGQWTEMFFELGGEAHRQDRIDAVVFQRLVDIDLRRRDLQQRREFPAQEIADLRAQIAAAGAGNGDDGSVIDRSIGIRRIGIAQRGRGQARGCTARRSGRCRIEQAAQPAAIAFDRQYLRVRGGQCLAEHRDARRAAHRQHARLRLQPAHAVGIRTHAALVPQRPVDRQRPARTLLLHDLRLTEIRERVEETVGGRVIGLADVAEYRDAGREQREEIEIRIRGGIVEMPGAAHLGREHGGHVAGVFLQDQIVAARAGAVQHAAQRTDVTDRLDDASALRGVVKIELTIVQPIAEAVSIESRGDVAVRRRTAGQHDLRALRVVEDVAREQAAEAAESTGDQIDAVFPVGRVGEVVANTRGDLRQQRPVERAPAFRGRQQRRALRLRGGFGQIGSERVQRCLRRHDDELRGERGILQRRRSEHAAQPGQQAPFRGIGDHALQQRRFGTGPLQRVLQMFEHLQRDGFVAQRRVHVCGCGQRLDSAPRTQRRQRDGIDAGMVAEQHAYMRELLRVGRQRIARMRFAPSRYRDQRFDGGRFVGGGVEAARAEPAHLHADIAVRVAEIQIKGDLGGIVGRDVGAAHVRMQLLGAVAENAQRFQREGQHRIGRWRIAPAQPDRRLQRAVDQRRMQDVGGVVLAGERVGQREIGQDLAVAAVQGDDAAVRRAVFDADPRVLPVHRIGVPVFAMHRVAQCGQIQRRCVAFEIVFPGIVETHATGGMVGAVPGVAFAEHAEFQHVIVRVEFDRDGALGFDRERRQPQHILERDQRRGRQLRYRIGDRRAGHLQIGDARQHADSGARRHPDPMIAQEEFVAGQLRAVTLPGQGRDIEMQQRMQPRRRRPTARELPYQLKRVDLAQASALQLGNDVFDEIHHAILSLMSLSAASLQQLQRLYCPRPTSLQANCFTRAVTSAALIVSSSSSAKSPAMMSRLCRYPPGGGTAAVAGTWAARTPSSDGIQQCMRANE